jgi:signal transduction histidine kinase
MNIQSRLSLIFVTLLIFGVTAVSSYSIVFIRDYLLTSGTKRLIRDTNTYSIAFKEMHQENYGESLELFQAVSEYGMVLLDSVTYREKLAEINIDANVSKVYDESSSITMYHNKVARYLYSVSQIRANSFLIVIQSESKLFEPVKTIRWIIYSGMFISIALILVVSTLTARSVSRPIQDLTQYAQQIASGSEVSKVQLIRNDEIGTLSNALNQMALTLKEDTLQLQNLYNRHRQFYADMTHEVRNPLHTIGGSLEMLEIDQLPIEEKQKYIVHARAQVERLNRMFTDLLTLQKFDSHEYSLKMESVDLREMFKTVCQSYKIRAEKLGIQLKAQTEHVFVLADKDKLEQVFDNLISNALNYSCANEIKLVAVLHENSVKIIVQDNGIGISEEDKKHLFVRFFRADSSRSREKGGTGLGLAVVKSILDEHKSDIYVQTSPGMGFRFEFDLKKA